MPDKTNKDSKENKIHKGHRERVRQKFLKTKLEGFADHEKLEFLLFYARPLINTNEIAHKLLNEFGSISKVFDASVEDLKKIKGVSDSTAILLKIIPEMSHEYVNTKSDLLIMDKFKVVKDYFISQFINEQNEVVKIACLDDRLRLIDCGTIIEGSPKSTTANIKKLIEFTYKNNCDSIILAHNHPDGNMIPFDDDLKMTKDIYNCLKPIGIKLIDYIIVADDQAVSFKESGAFSLVL